MPEKHATSKPANQDRRNFLKTGGAVAAGLLAQTTVGAATKTSMSPSNAATEAMPTRNLGKTGYRVGVFSLGGQAALEGGNNQAMAVEIVERALDLGVNYIDTSAIYGGPERWSERYIGQVMKRRRGRGFSCQQNQRADPRRLAPDAGAVLQTAPDRPPRFVATPRHRHPEDIDAIFAKGGAIEALQQAHEQGIVRHLGLTGHFRPDASRKAFAASRSTPC